MRSLMILPMISAFYFRFVLVFIASTVAHSSDFCYDNGKDACEGSPLNNYKNKRFLLYDVNPGEGFNLRRDVYMRVATLVKKLNTKNKTTEWTLVLPPWGPLYHWKTRNLGYQTQIKWEKFFDLPSLRKYIPVIDLEDFLKDHGSKINSLYYLQHYAEGWGEKGWEEKFHFRNCNEHSPYKRTKKKVSGWFWGYDDIFAEEYQCVSIQGYSSTLTTLLENSSGGVIMIDRAEVVLHDSFGDSEYWMVRRSMVFSNKLIEIGNSFRKVHLNSSDELDNTFIPKSLTSVVKREAIGGPFIAVHLRRQDFVQARPKEVPSITFTITQILEHMKQLNLHTVFIATDASTQEFKEIQQSIPGVVRFFPEKEVLEDILDGGVAIVDQWICAHARYFFGTHESTFSFRIQEEREILGFPVKNTFNRLCGDNETDCHPPSKWTIAF